MKLDSSLHLFSCSQYKISFVFLFLGVLAFGVKESAIVSKMFTAVNILVLLFVVLSGAIKGNLNNWCITQDSLRDQYKCAFLKSFYFKLLNTLADFHSTPKGQHLFTGTRRHQMKPWHTAALEVFSPLVLRER